MTDFSRPMQVLPWLAAALFYAPRSNAEPSSAPPPPPTTQNEAAFGAPGQWVVLGGSSSASIASTAFSNSDAHRFSVQGEVGVDRFVIRNFSIGVAVSGNYADSRGYGATSLLETKSRSYDFGVRFGVNVPLGRGLSWYPRLTLGIDSQHSDTQTLAVFVPSAAPPSWSASRIGPWSNLYAPLLVHPVPHFFVGLGPRIEHDFGITRGGPYGGSESTLLSLDFTVGGWWGGVLAEGHEPSTETAQTEFGKRGQIAITTATTASLQSFQYSKSDASQTSFNIEPGLYYFVADHVSFGIDVGFAHSSGTSFDAGGTKTDSSSTSFGVAPRLGYESYLVADVLSIWPQAELGFGWTRQEELATGGTNAHTRTRRWVEASLPLLVHAASHLFMGGGPYLDHELSDVDQNQYENDATEVGATFVLGGWL